MPALIHYFFASACLLLFHYSFGIEAQRQYDHGDGCEMSDGQPGKCELLTDCPSVYQDALAGKLPSKVCGYLGFDPVVCCPLVSRPPSTIGETITSTEEPPRLIQAETETTVGFEVTGRLAEQKCAEYAKSVYAMVDAPILSAVRRSLNISLCAIKSQKLIVGGTKAEPKEFPHMVAVGFDSKLNPDQPPVWLCGGTLVSDRFVLTAAHCVYTTSHGKAAWVRLGDLNLARDDDDARPQTIRITERIRHPEYKRPSFYHDIALLRLESRAVFNAFTRPACLPSAESDEGNGEERWERAVATGWGRVDWADDEGSNDLLKVTLNRVSSESCNDSYFGDGGRDRQLARGIVGKWQICAGQEGRDTCQGDSGGPIAVFNSKHECMYDVVGVTSLGRWCGSRVPGVYTRVNYYLSWLEDTIWR